MNHQTNSTPYLRVAHLSQDGQVLGWLESSPSRDVLANIVDLLATNQVPYEFKPQQQGQLHASSDRVTRPIQLSAPCSVEAEIEVSEPGDPQFMEQLARAGATTNPAISTYIAATLLDEKPDESSVSPDQVLALWKLTGKARPKAMYRDMRMATHDFSKNKKRPNDWLIEEPGKKFRLVDSTSKILNTPNYFSQNQEETDASR